MVLLVSMLPTNSLVLVSLVILVLCVKPTSTSALPILASTAEFAMTL
jgi:hypothetical protein